MRGKSIEFDCPSCRYTMESDGYKEVECPRCSTVTEIDEEGEIVGHELPEYHGTVLIVMSVISFICLIVILIDAAMSENAGEKLELLGICLALTTVLYFWLPFRMGYSREYMRMSAMIALTALLFIVLVINLSNFIR